MTATLLAISALGFISPGTRAERQEDMATEVRNGIKDHDRRITTLEANYGTLAQKVDQGNARLEGKLDKLLDLQIRASRRGP